MNTVCWLAWLVFLGIVFWAYQAADAVRAARRPAPRVTQRARLAKAPAPRPEPRGQHRRAA